MGDRQEIKAGMDRSFEIEALRGFLGGIVGVGVGVGGVCREIWIGPAKQIPLPPPAYFIRSSFCPPESLVASIIVIAVLLIIYSYFHMQFRHQRFQLRSHMQFANAETI